MEITKVTYLVFALVIAVALALDLGLLSKKNTVITIKKALFQTLFWVTLAIGFFVLLWFEQDSRKRGESSCLCYGMEFKHR